ncbi:hypothetical protein BgiBS90_030931, partial [Biomphalaria glabrata]
KASTQAPYHIKNVQNEIVYSLVSAVKDSQQIVHGAPTVQQRNSSKCSLQPSDLEIEHEY